MTPALHKATLTLHVATSVGWLGAAAAYIALVVEGVTTPVPGRVSAACLALEPVMTYAIVPTALVGAATGLVLSLGTAWGLFRHYWVIYKTALTALSTVILLLNRAAVHDLARGAANGHAEFDALKGQLVHAGLGIAVLVVTTVLGVYKPRALTRYGWRKRRAAQGAGGTTAAI